MQNSIYAFEGGDESGENTPISENVATIAAHLTKNEAIQRNDDKEKLRPSSQCSQSKIHQMAKCRVLMFATLLVPLQYYVGSIGFQLERKGDDNDFIPICSTTVVNFASGAIIVSLTPYCVWLLQIERRHGSDRSLLEVDE